MNISVPKTFHRAKVAFVSAILVLSCASLGFGQVDRSQKPAAGPTPKAVFPSFSEVTLKNGLRVIIVEDHRQPIVYFRTMILTGGATDGTHIGTTGAMAYLMQKGTTTRTADDIAKKIDFYGSEISVGANSDEVSAFTSILKKDLNEVLPVYADVILNPTFPQPELNKYISQRIAALKQEKQDPSTPGRYLARKLIFGDHPYGAIETEETTNAITRDAIVAWHHTNFCANNAVIAVIGDVTKEEILPLLEKEFGSWQAGTPLKPAYTKLKDVTGTQIYLINRPGSVQSDIRIERLGLRRSDPNFDNASFLASIFAGNGALGFHNRLMQNLREKHAYTYTPGGSLTSSIDPGVLVAVAEVRNAVTDSALEQMLDEYKRLSTEAVAPDELALAKSAVTGGFLMSLSDPNTTSENLLELIEYGLPSDYFKTYADRINALTPEEMESVAKQVFPANNLVVVVTGDAKEIKPKLARFGDVKVYNTDLEPEGSPTEHASMHLQPADIALPALLEKFYAAIPKSALEKIHDRTTVADVTISAGGQEIPATLRTIEQAPNKKYQQLTLTWGLMQNWVDGKHVWMQQGPKSVELTGSNLEQELADAEWAPELHLKNKKVTLLGMTALKGASPSAVADEAYVLEIEPKKGNPEKWYISKTSWLLVRKDQLQEGVATISRYSDFRPVDGVMIPYNTTQSGGQDLTISITEIHQNTNPAASTFVRPAETEKQK